MAVGAREIYVTHGFQHCRSLRCPFPYCHAWPCAAGSSLICEHRCFQNDCVGVDVSITWVTLTTQRGSFPNVVIICQSTIVMVPLLVCVTLVDPTQARKRQLARSRNIIAGVVACMSVRMNCNRKANRLFKGFRSKDEESNKQARQALGTVDKAEVGRTR